MEHDGAGITYVQNPELNTEALNELFQRASGNDFAAVLSRSLTYIAAFSGPELVGFVNIATDGGAHAFVLDPTVDPAFQRRGIGTTLLRRAAAAAAERGCDWLHVDFEPHLEPFYRRAGFAPTAAGLMRLSTSPDPAPAPPLSTSPGPWTTVIGVELNAEQSSAARWPSRPAAPSVAPFPFAKLRARGLIPQAILGAILAIVFARLVPGLIDKTATDSGTFGLFYFGIGVVIALRARAANLNIEHLFGPPPTRGVLPLTLVALPLGVLSIAGFFILFLPISYVAPNLVRTWAIEAMTRTEVHSFAAWCGRFAIAVIVAPVVEEIFFRGLLLQRWAFRWGTATGVVLSSALFAVGHVELLGHFLFGVAMSALYLRTKSLWLPISAHALNNFIVSVLTLPAELKPDRPDQQMTVASLQSNWWVGLVLLAVGGGLLELYRRKFWAGVNLRALLHGPVPYSETSSSGPQGGPSLTPV